MWPACERSPERECCRQSAPFFYFSRILFIQSLFRSKRIFSLIQSEHERHRTIAQQEQPSSVIRDWTDGEFFANVYRPFLLDTDDIEYPLALASGIDGADVLSWGSESITPMVQILLNLPPDLRCNLGLIHAVGLIPHIAKEHRQAVQRLDTFELNLMYQFGFPVLNPIIGVPQRARAIAACLVRIFRSVYVADIFYLSSATSPWITKSSARRRTAPREASVTRAIVATFAVTISRHVISQSFLECGDGRLSHSEQE